MASCHETVPAIVAGATQHHYAAAPMPRHHGIGHGAASILHQRPCRHTMGRCELIRLVALRDREYLVRHDYRIVAAMTTDKERKRTPAKNDASAIRLFKRLVSLLRIAQ